MGKPWENFSVTIPLNRLLEGSGPGVIDLLNDYGSAGWELVGPPTILTHTATFWFKREAKGKS